ncbi:MAG TPA: hypothetical protein VH234_05480 [Candidatus Saccharimonadales bacterium]|jgi:hypothetical protein|nr:hypothetical protein [Candidatus Saccharimonadales bacterium]
MNMKLPKRLKDGKPIDAIIAKEVRQLQDKYALSSGSDYRIHVFHVFNDPDFDRDIKEARKLFEDVYYKDVSLDPNSDHLLDEHKIVLYELAHRYCIGVHELWYYADGLYDEGAGYGYDMDELGGLMETGQYGLIYKIGPKTTQDQIKTDWQRIELAKEDYYGQRSGKKRPTFNHELVYAIFKARSRTPLPTWGDIFKQYQNGKLEGFTINNKSQYKTKEDLQNFYGKMKPTVKGF